MRTFDTEADFEAHLAHHFTLCGATVTRQAFCTVHNDTGSKTGKTRIADLHIVLPEVVAFPRVIAVEVKLQDQTGSLLDGGDQATAYMRAFDWRTEKSQHSLHRLAPPDIALLAAPHLLTLDGLLERHHRLHMFERVLWQRGAALLRAHRGSVPGCYYRRLEVPHLLTGIDPAGQRAAVPASVGGGAS